jgi:hypothetical protein
VSDLDMVIYFRNGLRRNDFNYEFKQLIQLKPTSFPSIIPLQPSLLPMMVLPRLFSLRGSSEFQICKLMLMTSFVVRSLVRKTPFTFPLLVPRLVACIATSLDTPLLTIARKPTDFQLSLTLAAVSESGTDIEIEIVYNMYRVRRFTTITVCTGCCLWALPPMPYRKLTSHG